MIKDLSNIKPVFFSKIKVKKYQLIKSIDEGSSSIEKEEFYKAIIKLG